MLYGVQVVVNFSRNLRYVKIFLKKISIGSMKFVLLVGGGGEGKDEVLFCVTFEARRGLTEEAASFLV